MFSQSTKFENVKQLSKVPIMLMFQLFLKNLSKIIFESTY